MPSAFKVGRATIVYRGLANRCPNCGAHALFQKGSLFRVNAECPSCGFAIERGNDEGFYLGSLSLNYGVTLVGVLLPIALLAYHDVIGTRTAAVLALVSAILFPILFYRSSRSWWLMNYYFFLPQHLPANGGKGRPNEDSNV